MFTMQVFTVLYTTSCDSFVQEVKLKSYTETHLVARFKREYPASQLESVRDSAGNDVLTRQEIFDSCGRKW